MKKLFALTSTIALCAATMASANDGLAADIANPDQWAIQTGDYQNQRYSTLDQINKDNVGDLQVAWTFSTGVLRGHEGSPLVIGDMMYVHTPFPNIVYALDLANAAVFNKELDKAGVMGVLALAVPATVGGFWAARKLRDATSG